MQLSRSALAFAALALVGLHSAPAAATQSRINAMGGGVKQWTIEDTINIFDFPSLLVRHGNEVYIDNLSVGDGFPNGRFGFHYNLGDDTVLALFGGHLTSGTRGATAFDGTAEGTAFDTSFFPAGNLITGGQSLGVGYEASQAPESDGGSLGAIGAVELRYGLMFATVLGSSTRLGLSFTFAADNDDIEQPTGQKVDRGGMLFDLGLGLGFDFTGSELELTAGVAFGFADDLRDATNVATNQQIELLDHTSVSHFGLRVGARWTFDFFNQSKIVTYTQLLFGSQTATKLNVVPGTPSPTGSYSGIHWVLGADLRLEPFEGVTVSPGLGVRFAQQTLEGTTQVNRDADLLMSLPFYGVAVDLRVADWLAVRFGANQSVNLLRDSDTNVSALGVTNQHDYAEVDTHFAMGLGFQIPVAESRLSIDLDVNPEWLVNGPDFVTGTATGGFGLNGALRYAW
ncbi:MAG: hypothetical protein EP329_11985 [Deltaproteobacteria bacterium]|nr:MAG: hypothetical protein EP329_11985 [Deltaproteobacteria bacterium]